MSTILVTVIKNFKQQWKGLSKRNDERGLEIHKITTTLSILKVGVRTIPLACVIREYVQPNKPILLRVQSKPYIAKYDSFERDLVALASHNNPNFKKEKKEWESCFDFTYIPVCLQEQVGEVVQGE
eukprot:15342740-Ditylum_brightwellii.AAC.1